MGNQPRKRLRAQLQPQIRVRPHDTLNQGKIATLLGM